MTSIVRLSFHTASAPKSPIMHNVRSIYGREIISPVRLSVSPLRITGPIINRAEIYCELTFPCISSVPPSISPPVIRSGGKPSSPTYSMFAPRRRRAFTSTPIGRWHIRSVPVMTCVPGRTERKAVMKRIAVPAALISMTSGMSVRAFTITSVSSQSDRLQGITSPPARALMTRARLLMLLDDGKSISPTICLGAVSSYCMFIWFSF